MWRRTKQLKNAITEIKSTLEGLISRLDITEKQISDLEDRVVEITQTEQEKKKNKINEDKFKRLWRQ